MSIVRHELVEDASQLADAARQVTDWREYVRAYPWLCAGGAAALGLLLAPSRPRSVGRPAPDATAPAIAGGTVFGLLAAWAGRTAASYATRAAMDYIATRSSHFNRSTMDHDERM